MIGVSDRPYPYNHPNSNTDTCTIYSVNYTIFTIYSVHFFIHSHWTLKCISIRIASKGKVTEYGQCPNTGTLCISETINPTTTIF